MWKLIALTELLAGKEYVIATDTVLGRHQQSDIVLPSERISRRHAALRIHDGELWLEDLNSAHGSCVNGERVDKQLLIDKDELGFDCFRFQVRRVSLEDAQLASQSETLDHYTKALVVDLTADQGMPTLAERDAAVQIQADGMPMSIGIPKPAPIPDTVNIHHPLELDPSTPRVDKQFLTTAEQRENVKVGMIAVLLLILIIAVVLYLISL